MGVGLSHSHDRLNVVKPVYSPSDDPLPVLFQTGPHPPGKLQGGMFGAKPYLDEDRRVPGVLPVVVVVVLSMARPDLVEAPPGAVPQAHPHDGEVSLHLAGRLHGGQRHREGVAILATPMIRNLLIALNILEEAVGLRQDGGVRVLERLHAVAFEGGAFAHHGVFGLLPEFLREEILYQEAPRGSLVQDNGGVVLLRVQHPVGEV